MTESHIQPNTSEDASRSRQRFPRGAVRFVLPLFLVVFVIALYSLVRSMMNHHFFGATPY